MYSLGHLYVAAHLDEMLNQAAAERLAKQASTSNHKARLTAAAKSLWSLLSGPAERPLELPTLNSYPYRG